MRPGLSDLAVLLGVTKIMIDERWYKPDFCRRFTDFPLLVRTDTLRAPAAAGRARPTTARRIFRRARRTRCRGSPTQQRQKIGDFCVWDSDSEAGRVHQPRRSRREHEDQRGAGGHVTASSWPTAAPWK